MSDRRCRMDDSRGFRKRSGHVPEWKLEHGKPLTFLRVQLWRTEKDASGMSARSGWSTPTSGTQPLTIIPYYFNVELFCIILHYAYKNVMRFIFFLQIQVTSSETLQNLTGRNISDYLVKTYAQIIGKRWVEQIQKSTFIDLIPFHRNASAITVVFPLQLEEQTLGQRIQVHISHIKQQSFELYVWRIQP